MSTDAYVTTPGPFWTPQKKKGPCLVVSQHPPPVPFMGIKIVDLAGQIEHRSMSSPQGESEKSEKELLSAANNPICRWMFSGVMV